MPFATRADLLARSNAKRLFNLAVPADMEMPADELMRAALVGGVTSMTEDEDYIETLTLALDAIDKALADADALIVSYGIPATAQNSLLARLASTIALYYLQGAERMTDEIRKAYEGCVDTLKSHAQGKLDLVPEFLSEEPASSTGALIESGPARYGRRPPPPHSLGEGSSKPTLPLAGEGWGEGDD